MDDTFVVQKKTYKMKFLEHINSSSLLKKPDQIVPIPFLDILVMPEQTKPFPSQSAENPPTQTSIYIKTPQRRCKTSVVNTLMYRTKTVCSSV